MFTISRNKTLEFSSLLILLNTHYLFKCVKYIKQNLHFISNPSKTVIAPYFQYGLIMINSKLN